MNRQDGKPPYVSKMEKQGKSAGHSSNPPDMSLSGAKWNSNEGNSEDVNFNSKSNVREQTDYNAVKSKDQSLRNNAGAPRSEDTPSVSRQSENKLGALKEIQCDLFQMPADYALAHCVGSDFIMSSGVAVTFRKKFRSVPQLLDQNKIPGDVAFTKHKDTGQYAFYLVTKLTSTGKPTWADFEKSVIKFSSLCVEHGIKKVAIPQIGCGRDKLDWSRVRDLINYAFSNTNIEVTVCFIECEKIPEKKWNLKLIHERKPLTELDPQECALVFIASRDRSVKNANLNNLCTQYGFLADYLKQDLPCGGLYHFGNKARGANIFGLVVKEQYTDSVSFQHISKCLQELKKEMKKRKLYYLGFEAFDDPKFQIVTRKVWTLVIDAFFIEDIHVHFCWPRNVKEECWEEVRP